MIYDDNFVWLHFPKCAGSKIEQLFKKYYADDKSIHQDNVGLKLDPTIAWHDTISNRETRDPNFKLGSRDILICFRRLPAWLESKYNFEYARDTSIKRNFEMILEGKFPESTGNFNHADTYIRKWMPDSIIHSQKLRFIRTENFKSDFIRIFGDYIDISKIPDEEFEQYENTSVKLVPEKVHEQLITSKNLIYEKCPKWRAVERLVYQDSKI